MSMKEILYAVPSSYDDFVRYVLECIEEDDQIKEVVLECLRKNSAANSSDVLEAIHDYLGINEPLEIVPDEELVTA